MIQGTLRGELPTTDSTQGAGTHSSGRCRGYGNGLRIIAKGVTAAHKADGAVLATGEDEARVLRDGARVDGSKVAYERVHR